MEELYLVREIAELYRVSHNAVLNWIDAGELDTYVTPGGGLRVPRRALDTLISNRPPPLALRLLLVGADTKLLGRLRTVADARNLATRLECAQREFEVGWWMAAMHPTHVALDGQYDLEPLIECYAPGVQVVALPNFGDDLGKWLDGIDVGDLGA